MVARSVAFLFALVCGVLLAQDAQAFFDPPWITPENPIAGEAVSINIRSGVCDGIFEELGYPQYTQEGNAIRIRWYGDHYPEGSGDLLCSYPIGTMTRPVGAYPPGNYTLTVELAYIDFFEGPSVLTIGVVPFTVDEAPGAVGVPVPTLSTDGMLALLALVLGLSVWKLRASHMGCLVLALAVVPIGAHAQDTATIRVLLSNAPGAPTPATVVTWVNSSPRAAKPPLQAFTVKSPQGGDYLIPDRATGDFLVWLNANPQSVRKKLEDYVLMEFATGDAPAALSALQADPYVTEAYESPPYTFSSVELVDFGIAPDPAPLAGNDQYGFFAMNVDVAWQLAGGYALVGQIDMGLYENHAALRQFSGGTYVGGNFVKTTSRDVGLTGRPPQAAFDPLNVDEKKSMWIDAGTCTPAGAMLPPAILGHGTHVAGLLGANGASGLNVQGTCKHCGIQVYKTTYLTCVTSVTPPQVRPRLNGDGADRGHTQAVDTGVQVLSMSYGANYNGQNYCQSHRTRAECLAISYAAARDVPMVAASGNQKKDLNFPASDKRLISAGGFEENLSLWDEAPTCPPAAPSECGSNWSKLHSGYYFTHQETLGSAKRVLSTTYPNTTWVDYAECGDGYGTPMGDGLGWCTGTSMSTPQIAGVVALLRSVNPLLPGSQPEPPVGVKAGLRSALAQTGARAQQGLGWDPFVGYGMPDAASAARRVLGTVAGATARNRATPLLRLWDAFSKDYAETTSPQYALSLMIAQVHNYVQPVSGVGAGVAVPGYTFPYDVNDPAQPDDDIDPYESAPATPRAAVYVLTTEYRSRPEWPALRPLHLMDKNGGGGKDYLLATTNAELETAYAAGYGLRTIQGYIYQPCTPEASCIPPSAQKLWRQYKAADGDCAVFLESEKSAFETAGYTAACPAGSAKMIGYAYPATDGDNDGLPDGFEYVVGTNPFAADSDGDGSSDVSEFPMTGLPVSDPCMGGTLGATNCGADRIFWNGFD